MKISQSILIIMISFISLDTYSIETCKLFRKYRHLDYNDFLKLKPSLSLQETTLEISYEFGSDSKCSNLIGFELKEVDNSLRLISHIRRKRRFKKCLHEETERKIYKVSSKLDIKSPMPLQYTTCDGLLKRLLEGDVTPIQKTTLVQNNKVCEVNDPKGPNIDDNIVSISNRISNNSNKNEIISNLNNTNSIIYPETVNLTFNSTVIKKFFDQLDEFYHKIYLASVLEIKSLSKLAEIPSLIFEIKPPKEINLDLDALKSKYSQDNPEDIKSIKKTLIQNATHNGLELVANLERAGLNSIFLKHLSNISHHDNKLPYSEKWVSAIEKVDEMISQSYKLQELTSNLDSHTTSSLKQIKEFDVASYESPYSLLGDEQNLTLNTQEEVESIVKEMNELSEEVLKNEDNIDSSKALKWAKLNTEFENKKDLYQKQSELKKLVGLDTSNKINTPKNVDKMKEILKKDQKRMIAKSEINKNENEEDPDTNEPGNNNNPNQAGQGQVMMGLAQIASQFFAMQQQNRMMQMQNQQMSGGQGLNDVTMQMLYMNGITNQMNMHSQLMRPLTTYGGTQAGLFSGASGMLMGANPYQPFGTGNPFSTSLFQSQNPYSMFGGPNPYSPLFNGSQPSYFNYGGAFNPYRNNYNFFTPSRGGLNSFGGF